MNKIMLPVFSLITAMAFFCLPGPAVAQNTLDAFLKPYLESHELPALAAAVAKDGNIIAAGAVGTRRTGQNIPVTIDDRFHLGSDTKAMTALLIAMQVEKGEIDWDSTVSQIFPEMAPGMSPNVRTITVLQLLSHTSGVPADNEAFGKLLDRSFSETGNLDYLRYWLVQQWAKLPLENKPGEKFTYANMNYVVAGAIVERLKDRTWEEIIVDDLFRPLDLKTAGLGQQSSLGKIDAPVGHALVNGKVTAILAGPCGDNPPIIGPAGTAHMSILDFAKWASWNAAQGRRGPQLVTPKTLIKLHTPVVSMPEKKDAAPGTPSHGKYALGWGQLSVDWAPYPLMYHGGSNGMNLAHIWVDSKKDLAIVLTTNIGGAKANEALLAAAAGLYKKFAGK
ncbi:MAG: serine hydrolase domain-containing protein [Smithellaceae bacterium]